MANHKILISQDISSEGKKYLLEKGYELKITGRTAFEELRTDAADCDAILARTCQYPSDIFTYAPKLKCIARHGAGYDNIDVQAASAHGVYVCITPATPVNSVAEHTIMLLLACAKNLVYHDKRVHLGVGQYPNIINSSVKDKVLGIVGFGKIGQAVA